MKADCVSYNFLLNLFEGELEQRQTKLVRFCDKIVKNKVKNIPMIAFDCRHSDCFYFGSPESDKHPGIRKSTLINFAIQTEDSKCLKAKTSTKMRCYHIAFFSKYEGNIGGLQSDLLLIREGRVIRHLCGCMDCCNPKHLKLGMANENQIDVGIHAALNACAILEDQTDYRKLLEILPKINFDMF
jgi:hypothetical protein